MITYQSMCFQSSQLGAEIVKSFQQLCILLQKRLVSEPQDVVKRVVVLCLYVIESLPSSFLQQGMDGFITLSLLALIATDGKCTYEKIILKEHDQAFIEEPKTIAYQRYLVSPSVAFHP